MGVLIIRLQKSRKEEMCDFSLSFEGMVMDGRSRESMYSFCRTDTLV